MLQSLPIDSVMPEIVAAVRDTPVVLLGAPPGSGKTTRVPPALLALFPRGEIVVLEPRRLAARAAATRVAEELGQQIGGTVGFKFAAIGRSARKRASASSPRACSCEGSCRIRFLMASQWWCWMSFTNGISKAILRWRCCAKCSRQCARICDCA